MIERVKRLLVRAIATNPKLDHTLREKRGSMRFQVGKLKHHLAESLKYQALSPIQGALLAKARPWLKRYYTGKPKRVIASLSDFEKHVTYHELVTFDIFDTILSRNVEPPEAVKEQSDAYGSSLLTRKSGRSITREGLTELRRVAESQVRDEARKTGDPEVSLTDILTRTVQLHLSQECVDDIVEDWIRHEVSCEKQHLFVRAGAIELLDRLKAKGKKIALVSDMYLEHSHLVEILGPLGILERVDKVFVSSTYRCGKYSGGLFKVVSDDFAIPFGNIIHTGDNMYSDYVAPLQHGLSAVFLRDLADAKRREDLLTKVAAANESGNWLEVGIESGLPNMVSNESNSSPEKILYEIGHNYLGPLYAIYTAAMLETAKQIGSEHIFFLAREGHFFKEVAEEMRSHRPEFQELQFHYLYCSRASTSLAAVHEIGSKEIRYARFRTGKHPTIESVLSTFGLPKAEFKEWMPKKKLAEDADDIDRYAQIFPFFGKEEVQTKILSLSGQSRSVLEGYLETESFFGHHSPNLIVDVGWNGTIQKFLAEAFSDRKDRPELVGFYLGRHKGNAFHEPARCSLLPGYIFDADRPNGEEHAIQPIIPLLEIAAAALHPSTISYEGRDKGFKPIFAPGKAAPSAELRESLRQGALEYAIAFAKVHHKVDIDLELLRRSAVRRAAKFCLQPTRREAFAVSKLKHELDWGSEEHLMLVSDVIEAGMVGSELQKEVERSFWKEAAFALAAPENKLAANQS